MPVQTLYRHGGKGGVGPARNDHLRAKRGTVQGWSLGATRRNTQFLMSVEEHRLTGVGYALTLTLRDCPATPGDWHRLRKSWTDRMRRLGMVRLHWVTEWQRRGVPHLHCAIWFDPMNNGIAYAIRAWVEVASAYGAGTRGPSGEVETNHRPRRDPEGRTFAAPTMASRQSDPRPYPSFPATSPGCCRRYAGSASRHETRALRGTGTSPRGRQ